MVDVTDVLYADAAEEKKDNEERWYESLDEEELHTVVNGPAERNRQEGREEEREKRYNLQESRSCPGKHKEVQP